MYPLHVLGLVTCSVLRGPAERFGKTTEAIRGTVVFEAGTGKHQWSLKWEHEPIISGKGDAVGLGTAQSEVAGPCEPPLLGGIYDDGASVALYANGMLDTALVCVAGPAGV